MTSCATTLKFEKAEIGKIRTVAVIEYTVPDSIEYKADPNAEESGLSLATIAKAAAGEMAKGDGVEAATVSHKAFIDTINQQGLPFRVISYATMMSKSGFTSLYVPKAKPAKDSGMAAMAMGMFGPKTVSGVGPEGINSFGIQTNWAAGVSLTGSANEMEYIEKSIQALGVDAVLLINDKGYSFSCQACVGAGGMMSGSGSTGSAFTATLVTRGGMQLINMREWFGATSSGAVMVNSMVNPLQHASLFKKHGEKTAILFADMFKERMASDE